MDTEQTALNQRLYDAVAGNDRSLVQKLLVEGADVNWRDQNGLSILHRATNRARKDVFEDLLAWPKADVFITDDDGMTLMHYAARSGNVAAMEALAGKGVEIDAVALDGRTPLMLAAHRDHVAAVDWLLLNKADPNAQDHNQRTALHYAVSRKFLKSTMRLVKGGADPHIEDHNRLSSIELATRLDGGASIEFNVSQFLNAVEVQKDIRHGTSRAVPAPKTAKFSRKPQQQA